MKDRGPLPRKRKIAKGEDEVAPKKGFIEPIIETRQVITGFIVGERQADKIRERATLVAWIRENYPQITKAQLEDAQIVYKEYSNLLLGLLQFLVIRL
jgi:hypothetical protein